MTFPNQISSLGIFGCWTLFFSFWHLVSVLKRISFSGGKKREYIPNFRPTSYFTFLRAFTLHKKAAVSDSSSYNYNRIPHLVGGNLYPFKLKANEYGGTIVI
ncbi:uncharacterized protein LOC128041295 [Gossypium raimondii]|uniref:uncharacterized protein LOC128041295 n=1 Tax=Gossypium raimondii TaxID=29730 RepID=UPI00227D2E21|nr:uncharacterized protein LOC128041295 [Gossypium raimondii]